MHCDCRLAIRWIYEFSTLKRSQYSLNWSLHFPYENWWDYVYICLENRIYCINHIYVLLLAFGAMFMSLISDAILLLSQNSGMQYYDTMSITREVEGRKNLQMVKLMLEDSGRQLWQAKRKPCPSNISCIDFYRFWSLQGYNQIKHSYTKLLIKANINLFCRYNLTW